jgi:hypothetical protein
MVDNCLLGDFHASARLKTGQILQYENRILGIQKFNAWNTKTPLTSFLGSPLVHAVSQSFVVDLMALWSMFLILLTLPTISFYRKSSSW